MGIIKDELHAGRPVFYGGSSDVGSGGHAFVIDGYDSADFVHVNWGWGGNSNGYFMINHLDPSSLGIGGGAGGYNLNQDMVTGIQPATFSFLHLPAPADKSKLLCLLFLLKKKNTLSISILSQLYRVYLLKVTTANLNT